MKKIMAIAGMLLSISCNAAIEGYNAPLGSVVTFIPDSTSQIACAGPGRLYKVSVLVQTPNSISGELQPAQNIFGQLEANGPINLYLKSENAEVLVPLLSQVDLVNSGNINFTTNKQGMFEFVAALPGDENTVEDFISANIGTAVGTFSMSSDCDDD